MRKTIWAVAGATTLLVAAACTDRNVPTDIVQRGVRSGPASHDATPFTGAVYTSTNPAVDDNPDLGSQHDLCHNATDASPAIDCNLYLSKSFVWLSGGPDNKGIPDGTYVFAVLDPGGQQDPNDCTDANLSDITPAPPCTTTNSGAGDSWQHRVFSVSGGILTYPAAGYLAGHTFANNMIRLMPYDDTPNPGGEYVLAVCQLPGAPISDSGPGVDPSNCKYDNFKVINGENCADPTLPDCGNQVQGATVNTVVHLADHTVISAPVPLGSSVHDKATVTTSGGAAIPTNSKVTFYFWNNGTCDGTPSAGPDDHAMTGASPQSYDGGQPEGPLGAGDYSYQANFTSGDPTTVSDGEGTCEPLTVNKANTTIVTHVHNASHVDITNTIVATGTYIHDNATVGTQVGSITITGTVTFSFYTNSSCSGTASSTETVAVGSESTPQQITTVGSYAYSAQYNGDANYNASSNSDCEPLGVAQFGRTMGFWGNTNGIAAINGAGGYSVNAVAIGRGSNIDTQDEALKVLPLTLNACGKGAVVIFAGQTSTKACTLATGINVGTLNASSAQTLALGYNIKLITQFTGETIASLGCSAYLTAGLVGTNTVNDAFAKAVLLIDGSASGGTTTQGQLGALNLLLNCLNRETP
jgi:hypothetical protein